MKPVLLTVAALAALALAAPARADGDPVAGKTVFMRCAICHTIDPTMFGVVGRHSATVPGYMYSDAMKAANKTWDPATLNQYLTKPSAMVPGTKMIFPGLPSATDRANVIAYLATLK